jgi:hypothetical protein
MMIYDSRVSFHLMRLDGNGSVVFAAEQISRYRRAAIRQHGRYFDENIGPEDALVELHFLFSSIHRIQDSFKIIYKYIGNEGRNYCDLIPFSIYEEARHHFEHIDDRVYGEKSGDRKRAPKSVSEGDGDRIVHFGMRKKRTVFYWSDLSIDLSSDSFLKLIESIDGVQKYLLPEGVDAKIW